MRPREKNYKINTALANNGHIVLRVPPYKYDLSAIELAWNKMESIINENEIVGEFVFIKLEALLRYVTESVTPDDWREFVETTINIENEYVARDEQMEGMLENLVDQRNPIQHDLWADKACSSSSDL